MKNSVFSEPGFWMVIVPFSLAGLMYFGVIDSPSSSGYEKGDSEGWQEYKYQQAKEREEERKMVDGVDY